METVYKIYKHSFRNGDCYIGRSGEDDLHRRFKSGWGYQQDCPEFFSAIMESGW